MIYKAIVTVTRKNDFPVHKVVFINATDFRDAVKKLHLEFPLNFPRTAFTVIEIAQYPAGELLIT